MTVASGLLALAASTCKLPTILIWNVTASVPRGLYLILPASRLKLGTLVVCRLPPAVRQFASQRRYLPADIP